MKKNSSKLLCRFLILVILVTLVYIPEPASAVPGPVQWRPMVYRSETEYMNEEADFPEYYTEANYGGEGMQFIHGAAVHADGTVVMGQDCGSVRISTDFGVTWYTPPNEGNPLLGANSCAIDPADSDILFVDMSSGWRGAQYPSVKNAEGIYRSEDKGQSWSLVRTISGITYRKRYLKDNFACYPVSGGIAATRTWRFITLEDGGGMGSLWTSTGGISWTKVRDIDPATFGDIYALKQHPTSSNTLYICTSQGVWRTTDGGSNWARPWTITNTKSRAIWVDPDNVNHMIVSVYSTGIWETANGGSSWTNILSNSNMGHMAVGAKNASGQRMIYVYEEKTGVVSGRVRKFDGTWITAVQVPIDPEAWTQASLGDRLQSAFFPHPITPDLCLAHGRAFWWRSEGNGGAAWNYSSTNFFGTGIWSAAFDENNWQKMDFAVADLGTTSTTTGGDWMTQSNISNSQFTRMQAVAPNLSVRTGVKLVRLPDPWPSGAPAPASSGVPGRMILSLGNTASTQFLFKKDKGQSIWDDWIEEPVSDGGRGSKRTFMSYSWQNPNVIYAGQNISTDGGTSWNGLNYMVTGMSYLNGDIIYAVAGSGSSYTIYKSTNRGQNWTSIFNASWKLADADGNGHTYADPGSDQRLYTISANKDVYLLKNSGGTWSGTNLNLRGEYGTVPADWEVEKVCIDWSDSHIIYAAVNNQGAPVVWRGRLNENFTACSWEDITENAPRLGSQTNIEVHPITGDLIMGSSDGNFVYPAPEDWQHKDAAKRQYKRALWNNLPLPIPNGIEPPEPPVKTYEAKKNLTPITVNGKLSEGMWDSDAVIGTAVIGTPDNTAGFAVLWDNDYLYIGGQILDGSLYNDSGAVHHDDSFEVFIDADNNKGTTYDSYDRQFIVGYNDGILFEKNNNTTGVLFGTAVISGGYSVEVAIPWSNLGITPENGLTIGFDMGNNDDDDGGNRDHKLHWNSDEDINHINTSKFGNVLLSSETVSSTIIINDSFENMPTGSEPSGWIKIKTANTSCTVVEDTGTGNKCVRLYDNDMAGEAKITRSFSAQSGVITIEYSFKETLANKYSHLWLASDSTLVLYIADDANRNLHYKNAENQNVILEALVDNTWYDVRAIINTDTDLCDIYVNGVLKVNQGTLRNQVSSVNNITLGTATAITSDSFYVDNIFLATDD